MATFKLTGGVSHFQDKLINGMVGRGYTQEFAEQTFKQIEGFGSYGFPRAMPPPLPSSPMPRPG
jgi:error-prone DNA polymerase